MLERVSVLMLERASVLMLERASGLMLERASGLMLAVVLVAGLPSSAAATVYEVGPGRAYLHPGEVPWESLAPGDSVKIHHRDEDYRQKWVLCRRGTEEAPIVVQGIPSSEGERPVINGIDAATRPELDYWNENRGVIKIGGASQPPDVLPAHLVIEGLDIRSARPPIPSPDGTGSPPTPTTPPRSTSRRASTS